jgi:hypothetical protein
MSAVLKCGPSSELASQLHLTNPRKGSRSIVMNLPHPNCDRHTNLQMVPCWLKRPEGVVPGHVCPVPGCGRYHADEIYLDAHDIELVLGPKKPVPTRSMIKKTASEPNSPKPLNRHAAARAAILKAIEQKRQH